MNDDMEGFNETPLSDRPPDLPNNSKYRVRIEGTRKVKSDEYGTAYFTNVTVLENLGGAPMVVGSVYVAPKIGWLKATASRSYVWEDLKKYILVALAKEGATVEHFAKNPEDWTKAANSLAQGTDVGVVADVQTYTKIGKQSGKPKLLARWSAV